MDADTRHRDNIAQIHGHGKSPKEVDIDDNKIVCYVNACVYIIHIKIHNE